PNWQRDTLQITPRPFPTWGQERQTWNPPNEGGYKDSFFWIFYLIFGVILLVCIICILIRCCCSWTGQKRVQEERQRALQAKARPYPKVAYVQANSTSRR